jgi:hypothetical protein
LLGVPLGLPFPAFGGGLRSVVFPSLLPMSDSYWVIG